MVGSKRTQPTAATREAVNSAKWRWHCHEKRIDRLESEDSLLGHAFSGLAAWIENKSVLPQHRTATHSAHSFISLLQIRLPQETLSKKGSAANLFLVTARYLQLTANSKVNKLLLSMNAVRQAVKHFHIVNRPKSGLPFQSSCLLSFCSVLIAMYPEQATLSSAPKTGSAR